MSRMVILAFDTTSEHGGAGIFRDHQCLAAAESNGESNYSVLIFQMLERLLSEARLNFSDIELFAVANGPGSFTGIRVGVAAAQGWARAFGRPVCGVSTLAALAALAQVRTEWAISILDARRGEIYAGLFRRPTAGTPLRLVYEAQGEAWISKPEHLEATISQKIPAGEELTCLMREHDQTAQLLAVALPAAFHRQRVPGTLAPAIAGIALEASAQGRLQSPAELDACYIRRTDAELYWRE